MPIEGKQKALALAAHIGYLFFGYACFKVINGQEYHYPLL